MSDTKCSCATREFFPAKARFTENGFEHIISFKPGFICERFLADRNDPHNHGKSSADVLFLVRNEHGAVQFSLMTGWYLDWKSDNDLNRPMPSDLGYHSLKPRYEDQNPMGECIWLNNATCYYDGSTLNAEEPFDILLSKGESALWAFLEQYHRDTFPKDSPTSEERQ